MKRYRYAENEIIILSIIFRKLLNIEKHSKTELLLRQSLIQDNKPSKDYQQLSNNLQRIEEDNRNLEKTIDSLCNKVIWTYENNNIY